MVLFNGYDLAERFIVGACSRELMVRDVKQVDVPGMDGALLGSANYAPLTIAMTVTYMGDQGSRSDAFRELAAALDVREPAPLALPEDGGRYYLAIPSGGEVLRYYDADQLTLTFKALDPTMYGEVIDVDIPSGGSATFTVGGNYPAAPSILVGSATVDQTTGCYGLRLDGGDALDIATGTVSAAEIEIDCASRTATVNGYAALPTLASDWFSLTPGEHTVANHLGSGAAVLSYRERWV